MDRLNEMAVFVAVAEAASFVGAARELGMSPPAVTRCIASLEGRLGVKLLERTTRYVRVSDAGQRYLEDARRILVEVDAAEDAVVGINATPKGLLSITAPVLFGKMYVMPVIVEYLQRYPQMDVTSLFLDRFVNLMEEGIDVGVRIGELPDSSSRAIAVSRVRRVVCASPNYLAQYGRPASPDDLAAHTLIAASPISTTGEWHFRMGNSTAAVRIHPRLIVSTNDAAIEPAVSGFGIVRLISYQIAPLVASGKLEIVLSDYEPAALPVNIVHRESRHKSARVRSFIDLIVERLRAHDMLVEK